MAALKNAAISNGEGEWIVFSIRNGVVARYTVFYEAELHKYFAPIGTVPSEIEDAFSLMLDADALRPNIFSGAQQTIIGNIDVLGGGPHNPVSISVNGEQDSSYGSFIYYAQSCLSSAGCASRIDPALGKIAGADSILNGFGISIQGYGGNVDWENLPPGFNLWLCNKSHDCALLVFNKQTGQWEYKESRAEDGLGKRYPKYNETINYNSFSNSGEANNFQNSLRAGGIVISGTWIIGRALACVSAGGGQEVCHWVTTIQ